jgi:pimeloyl-ACP methyl ester carboxylesterase
VTTDLQVTETGSGETLVLFVHGALGSGRSFNRVAEALTPGYRMLWYDRRGYGSSRDAAGTPATVERHIDDILAILDGRPAIVAGHSFGGVPAIGAAVRAPEVIRAVVAYETGMAWVPGWDDTALQRIFADADPPDAGLQMMLGERYGGLSDDERVGRLRDAVAFIAEERSARADPPPFNAADLRIPLVYGTSDERVMPAVTRHLQQEVRTLEIVTIPGAGHHAHRAAPGAFAQLIRRAHALTPSTGPTP